MSAHDKFLSVERYMKFCFYGEKRAFGSSPYRLNNSNKLNTSYTLISIDNKCKRRKENKRNKKGDTLSRQWK